MFIPSIQRTLRLTAALAVATLAACKPQNSQPATLAPEPPTPPAPAAQSGPVVGAASREARAAAFMRVVQASATAADTAARNGFGDAQPLWFATIGSACFGEPVSFPDGAEGARVLDTPAIEEQNKPAGGRSVIVVPVLKEDANLLWVRQWFASRTSYARYLPEMHTILVRLDEESTDTWLGIMTLHEAWHAGEWITRQYDWRDPRTFSDEERKTHEFEHRLTVALGGDTYRTLVSKEAARLKAAGTRSELIDGTTRYRVYTAPRIGNYEASLGPIFGPAKSSLEGDIRATAVHIEATFAALGNDEEAATVFMQARYTTIGAARDDGSVTRK